MLRNMKQNADNTCTRSTHRDFDIDLLMFYLSTKYPHIRTFIQDILQRPLAVVFSLQFSGLQ